MNNKHTFAKNLKRSMADLGELLNVVGNLY